MQADAFEKLLPSWEKVKVLKRQGNFPGTSLPEEVYIETFFGPLKSTWHLKHVDVIPGHEFSDLLISGPFQYYKHRHLMQDYGENQSMIIDQLSFNLPMGSLGNLAGYPIIKAKFDKLFKYRHEVTQGAFNQVTD